MYFNRTHQTLAVALLVAVCVPIQLAIADADERQGKRRGPPPEAIEACASQVEGDACGFSDRRGEDLSGTCMVPPRGETSLACAPEGGPPGHHPPDDEDPDTA